MMEIDGNSIRRDELVEASVCIVGAGPVGLAAAIELGRRGVETVILESGDRESVLEPATRVANVGRDYPIADSRGEGIGGSSRKWFWRTPLGGGHAQFPPMDPADFDASPPELPGWPIDYGDVAQHFDRTAEICGLKPAWSGSVPRDSWLAPPGIHLKFFTSARGAAFWVDAADEARALGSVRLIHNARVVRLLTANDDSRITRLEVASRPGHTFHVQAQSFVLATGGIENARLLLTSRDPHGNVIGDHGGWLGRCFMEHLNHDVGYLVPRDRRLLRDARFFEQHVSDGSIIHCKYQISPELRRTWGLPSVTYQFAASRLILSEAMLRQPDLDGSPGEAVRSAFGGLGRLRRSALATRAAGTLVRRVTRGPRLLKVRGSAEQHPSPRSRVVLSERHDEYGVPVAALDWRISDRDFDGLAESVRRLKDLLERHGVGTLFFGGLKDEWRGRVEGGYHHMGSTRMSASPQDGVVDTDCRVHGWRNLFVAGSSVFPTGGSANPTFTAIALSVRLAKHLNSRQASRAAVVR